jgi:CRISPR-associated protein Csb2
MAAADGAKKEVAEWPPHPDRVFMALAAAWFETGQDNQEGHTLRWLEGLKPPGICASQNMVRENVISFVPVNDISVAGKKTVEKICADPTATVNKYKETGLSVLPEFRPRQPRSFPIAIPDNPVIHFVWEETIPDEHIEPLTSLCRKVISVGHSASLVQMWFTGQPPAPNIVPTSGVTGRRLRIFWKGRLEYLEKRYNRNAVIEYFDKEKKIRVTEGKEKTRMQAELQQQFPAGQPGSFRPEPGLWHAYGGNPEQSVRTSSCGSTFAPELVIFHLSGRRVSLPATLNLTEALRGALFCRCETPIPEWLSGHTAQGEPTNKPHVALLPLPFTGSNHADGRLMGLALALPRDLDDTEVDAVLSPLLWDEYGQAKTIELFNGKWFECSATLETRESPPLNLRSETWTGPSRRWATVTPLVLDRHFDGKDKWEHAAESVKDGCSRIGLPRPAEVLLHQVSMFEGVPRSNQFPWVTRKKDGGKMHHVHAVIVFNEKIEGPVMLGAGRFRGYGFCRPMKQGG